MPWCDECSKYWTVSSLTADGSCPTCGRKVSGSEDPAKVDVRKLAGEDAKAPWHFKLLVVLAVLYLVWRIVDLVGLVG